LIPDFSRDVYCVLGLPFDALDMAAATRRIRAAVQLRRQCFFSTPNLSFVTAALTNPALRDSVVRSDMSIADGMPLLWAARLMGVPLPERVAGSSLFATLWHAHGAPIKVLFFGGAEGVAEAASQRLNADAAGLRCVGFDSPGFGTVAQMSSDDRIGRINATGAEFIVVSIGVAKGQAWIEHNRERLHAPVLAYLGAVVNFVAGKVKRAPAWMQHAGLEWLWRIREEPSLWRRYASDGVTFARLLATRIVPYAWNAHRNAPGSSEIAAAAIEYRDAAEFAGVAGAAELHLRGAWTAANLHPLRQAFTNAAMRPGALRLDVSQVSHLDSAAVALLCLLWAHFARGAHVLQVSEVTPGVERVIRYCCAEYVLGGGPARE
jgi:N-acetylglucosaminyldiphosphoundecaprenol N-acetyl-beta-D-mannosaminyltransferase